MRNLLIITMALFVFTGYAQNQNLQSKIDSLQHQIIEVEKKLTAREKELIDIQKDINIVLDKAIDAKDKAYKIENELWSEKFGWVSRAIALVSAIFGLFIGWFGLRKLLENKANIIFERYLIDRFKEIKESDITTLYNEIESAAWKAQIRNKKILILNQIETKLPKDFQTALKIFNPETKDIAEPKNALKIDFTKYAMVILENYEPVGFWDLVTHKNDLIKLTDKICAKETAFIYYGDNRKGFYPETNVNKHLVNYANSPSQLYNNVMNTLKFQDLLSKV